MILDTSVRERRLPLRRPGDVDGGVAEGRVVAGAGDVDPVVEASSVRLGDESSRHGLRAVAGPTARPVSDTEGHGCGGFKEWA